MARLLGRIGQTKVAERGRRVSGLGAGAKRLGVKAMAADPQLRRQLNDTHQVVLISELKWFGVDLS